VRLIAVLEHELRGANIADVFDMPADTALEVFTELTHDWKARRPGVDRAQIPNGGG
jgi:hypothetical protein